MLRSLFLYLVVITYTKQAKSETFPILFGVLNKYKLLVMLEVLCTVVSYLFLSLWYQAAPLFYEIALSFRPSAFGFGLSK